MIFVFSGECILFGCQVKIFVFLFRICKGSFGFVSLECKVVFCIIRKGKNDEIYLYMMQFSFESLVFVKDIFYINVYWEFLIILFRI